MWYLDKIEKGIFIKSAIAGFIVSCILFAAGCANTTTVAHANVTEDTASAHSSALSANDFDTTPITSPIAASQPVQPEAAPSMHMRQRITGRILDTDGKTPVAGATVYIANNSVTPKRMLGSMSINSSSKLGNSCALPLESYYSYACSDSNGQFELTITDIKQLPLPVKFRKDYKQVQIDLSLNDLSSDIGSVSFMIPEEQKQTVAVVIDFFNPYEEISNQLKINNINPEAAFLDITAQLTEALEINPNETNIDFPKFEALFEDADGNNEIDLFNYSAIYINNRDSNDIASLEKSKKKHLLKFISQGGQLYMTEWTFELPEIPLDQYI